jgi:hypothetical protein
MALPVLLSLPDQVGLPFAGSQPRLPEGEALWQAQLTLLRAPGSLRLPYAPHCALGSWEQTRAVGLGGAATLQNGISGRSSGEPPKQYVYVT